MKKEAEEELRKEALRSTQFVLDFVAKYPEDRREMAENMLGLAIGTCDTFGVDASAVLNAIRQDCGTASELLPPWEQKGIGKA